MSLGTRVAAVLAALISLVSAAVIPSATAEGEDGVSLGIGNVVMDLEGSAQIEVIPDPGPFTIGALDAELPNIGDNDAIDSDANPSDGFAPALPGVAAGTFAQVDAGMFAAPPPTRVAGAVFEDLDESGTRQQDEPPVPGVTVELWRSGADGNPEAVVATDVTNAGGEYSFSNLTADLYVIRVVAPPTGCFVEPDVGDDDLLDSDVDPTTGLSAPLDVLQGSTTRVDAGVVPCDPPPPTLTPVAQDEMTVAITFDDVVTDPAGRVDVDIVVEPGTVPLGAISLQFTYDPAIVEPVGDGDRSGCEFVAVGWLGVCARVDPGVVALAGFSVTDPVSAETVLARVTFAAVGPGLSPIDVESDITASDPAAEFALSVVVTPGSVLVDDAVTPLPTTTPMPPPPPDSGPGTIQGLVFEDINANGVVEAGEPGIAGIEVELWPDGSDAPLGSTITDTEGRYTLIDVSPDVDYRVRFVNTTTGCFTKANAGEDDSVDSDADPADGFAPVPLGVDLGTFAQVDAGIVFCGVQASIGGTITEDSNEDGQRNPGEPPVPGITLELWTSVAGSPSEMVASDVSDSSGAYLFPNLPAGSFFIRALNPSGRAFTMGNAADDDVDSDIDPATGFSGEIALAEGQNVRVDAGLLPGVAPTTTPIALPVPDADATPTPTPVANVVIDAPADPGPFSIAPSNAEVSGIEAAFVVPDISMPAAPASSGGGDSAAAIPAAAGPGLAQTGASQTLVATLAIAAITIGGVLTVNSRREF